MYMTNNINAMKKAIIIVSILFTSVLAWGQDMAMFPNVSFENNYDGMQTTVNGETCVVTINYRIMSNTEEFAINALKKSLKERVKWIEINECSNGVLKLQIIPNMADVERRCTILSTYKNYKYTIIQRPRANIIEFKVINPRKENSLEETVEAALKQIEEKNYDAELINRGVNKENIHHYGFAFKGKEVLIDGR